VAETTTFYCRHCRYSAVVPRPRPLRCPRCRRRQPAETAPVPAPVDESAPRVGPDPQDTLPAQEVPVAIDAAVGRGYELREELGHGGMGEVYAARQRALDRLVAVKTLKRDAADEAALAQFRAEAVVTAYLEHPNIVPVHDLAAGADGALLLAMKKIEGVTWRALLHPHSLDEEARARRLTLDDHLEVLLKVCDGVGFAHARGVLHCDLKPDNVMIGEYGEVLITDWGCALGHSAPAVSGHAAPRSALIPRIEDVRTLRGSPAYMAPEVARGEVRALSPRTDVFLLGAALYEVLTGKPPHQGREIAEVIANAARGVIEPPPARAPARLMPEELCALAMHALDADPLRRPDGVAAFATRLRDYRRHAEAVQLAEAAKAQLTLARASPDAGDEHYRRAIAFCERAIDMWPEYAGGRNQLAEAQIDYAAYALGARAFALAHAQAFSAAAHARHSDRWDLYKRAEKLAEEARRNADTEHRRRRQVGWLRSGMAAAAALIILGLGGGILVIDREHAKLSDALAAARSSESRAELARWQAESSVRALRALGPGFVARSRRAWDEGRWSAAAQEADAALRIDPEAEGAAVLEIAGLAMAGEAAQARAAAARLRESRPGDPVAAELEATVAGIGEERPPELVARLRELVEREAPARPDAVTAHP
jgi:serine/threonine protein kinase